VFPSTRWKAYLKKIRENAAQDNAPHQTILHIYHSQDIWFAQEQKKDDHQASAKENLKRSDAILRDCSDQVNTLEVTLANTPKPSEMLDWNKMTLSDLM
jgi:uncharacterized damage-inducible protein DinB